MSDNTDWKAVAASMHDALSICMKHLRAPVGSSGMIGRFRKDGYFYMRHWREIVADALEKYPGTKIDREACHSNDMSKRDRAKFWKEREKKAAAQKRGAK